MANALKYKELSRLTEDQARDYLEEVRWRGEPVCPHCDSKQCYKLTPKSDSKRPVRKGVYKCKECRKQFTVTIGTIFEGSHIKLHAWLQAIYLMCTSKKGISANQLHRMLDITYKSAWFMCHRIRFAMENTNTNKLNGIIEVDETYVGGKGGRQGRSTQKKTPVVSVIQRDGEVRSQTVN